VLATGLRIQRADVAVRVRDEYAIADQRRLSLISRLTRTIPSPAGTAVCALQMQLATG
jgi:ribosome maturation protein Sdo1